MRKKKNLDKRLSRCAHLIVAEPSELKGQWREGGFAGLHVEIGCGKGRFINTHAERNPKVAFVGIERVDNALIKATESAMASGISNLRFICKDARLLPEFFAESEIERIYLNFSDPWPRSRQRKRRLTHGVFLSMYSKLLPIGGEIHFKTDNRDLFEFSLNEFSKYNFRLKDISLDLHRKDCPDNVMTEYEEKFSSVGMPIYALTAINPGAFEYLPHKLSRTLSDDAEDF